MDNDYLLGQLNDSLAKVGTGANPSLTNLVLHGPINKELIKSENLENLRYAEKSFPATYEKQVLPKLDGIFRSITRDDYSSICRGRLPRFQKRSGTSLRNKLRDSYRGDFVLDEVTSSALFNRDEFHGSYTKDAKFWFNTNSDYIINFRHKKGSSKKDKLMNKFDTIGEGARDRVLSLAVDVARDNYNIWNNYGSLLKKHGKETCDILLKDYFGIKIVDCNMGRFSENGVLIANAGENLAFYNFNTVENEDHRKRNEDNRPGGFHITLSDKSLQGFAIEVQYRSLQDEIFNMLGENASFRYENEGKKSNVRFSG